MPNEADAKFISSERMRRAKKERQGRAASPEPWARAITRYLYRFAVCRRLSQTSPSVRHLEKPHSLVRICRLLRNPQTLGGILFVSLGRFRGHAGTLPRKASLDNAAAAGQFPG